MLRRRVKRFLSALLEGRAFASIPGFSLSVALSARSFVLFFSLSLGNESFLARSLVERAVFRLVEIFNSGLSKRVSPNPKTQIRGQPGRRLTISSVQTTPSSFSNEVRISLTEILV